MALSDSRLKSAMYSRLLSLFTQAENTEMSKEDFADSMSGIIAEEVVSEITSNAVVSTTTSTPGATPGPATLPGTGSGTVT